MKSDIWSPLPFEVIFRPEKPVEDERFLVGRVREINSVHSTLRRGGHPFIFGQRGVGKTSLARIAINDSPSTVFTQCVFGGDFDSWARQVLRGLAIEPNGKGQTSTESSSSEMEVDSVARLKKSDTQEKTHTLAGWHERRIEPMDLFDVFSSGKYKKVVIIDEFDRILSRNERTVSKFGDLLKILTNRSSDHNIRLVFLCVGHNFERLFKNHPSVFRSLSATPLGLLTRDNIIDFLARTEEDLNSSFGTALKVRIANDSLGQPHFVHKVGLHTLQHAWAARSSKAAILILESHYEFGLKQALEDVLFGLQSVFSFIRPRRGTPDELFVRYLSLNSRGRVPYLAFKNKILGALVMNANSFDDSFNHLRGNSVIDFDFDSQEILFTHPYILPFLRLHYRGERKLPDDTNQLDLDL